MALSESVRKQISELVGSEPVVVFMKGNRRAPQCGFSATVVQILDDLLPAYRTVDVLTDPALRDGIKEFSEWPTIPQVYIGGKFVGGCDILREMNGSGELAKLLGSNAAPAVDVPAPRITVSDAAAEAFLAAAADAGGDPLRFTVSPRFEYDLFFGAAEAGDLEVHAGALKINVDRASALRADGVRIDFVGGAGGGFKIDNPNEPPRVKQIAAPDLKALLDKGEIQIFDVRPNGERAIATIDAARALDPAGIEHLSSLDKATPIAFYCHHGVRSQGAAERAISEGFRNVYNLKGGIDAWSASVDPKVPRY